MSESETPEQLAQRSEHFHAFEWLRGEAMRNTNAELALIEWSRFSKECKNAKELLIRIRSALQTQAVPLCKCLSCENGRKLIGLIDAWLKDGGA